MGLPVGAIAIATAAPPGGSCRSIDRRSASSREFFRLQAGGMSSSWCHALFRELLQRSLALGEVRQPEAAQDVRRLRELDVVVANDLHPVAPGIEEIQKPPRQR